jgi:CheY-like chemotaxis protein
LGRHACCGGITVAQSPPRLLLVEDHDATRQGLAALLAGEGYVVLSTGTFAEGRELLATQAPDLLIADVRLGEYNGLQLVAALPRAAASIIVTGFPDPALESEALKLGARYITKPIDPDILLALVDETIASARRRQSVGSTRRWDRKEVAAEISVKIEDAPARIVDVSYGGVKFEIERDQSVPPSFRITVDSPELSIDADLVWETESGQHRVCGAAISSANAVAVTDWARLVDVL